MDKLLETLARLVPAGIAIAIVAFLYLVVLFKRVSDRFIELNQKQAEFLKDRIDVVDKASVIFTRAIEQQEKEIRTLKSDLDSVNASLAQTRSTLTDKSVEEVTAIGDAVRQVLKLQEATLGVIAARSENGQETPGQAALVKRNRELSQSLEVELPKLLGRRDLSRYSVEVSALDGARELVTEFESPGLPASVYKSLAGDSEAPLKPDDHEAMWVGSEVPPEVAFLAIQTARKRWPFSRFIHVSEDGPDTPPDYVHLELFFGGATSAAARYRLLPWDDSEIDLLPINSAQDFHNAIRAHYG